MVRTIRYHLGTLAKGSFIITLVKIPRLILTYIHSQLKGKVSCEIMQSEFKNATNSKTLMRFVNLSFIFRRKTPALVAC